MKTDATTAIRACILSLFTLCWAAPMRASDWPMWRYDANRSAASPEALPATLHLQWVREYPALEPCWEDPVNQDRMPFDRVYEPVVMGETLFVGSNRNDRLTALSTRTGEETWRFYAGGPIRFAPACADGRVYVASDDGHLYCLDAASGKCVWKVRGGPDARKVLGNGRLVSAWPARGGPVVFDHTVYFGASIWPFMGIFIRAVDARTGATVWCNEGIHATFMKKPHGGADSFGGLAPQGAFAIAGDKLLVPNGRAVPAGLDRTSGHLLYYHLSGTRYHQADGSANLKLQGASHVSAVGSYYFNHRGLALHMYDAGSGEAYTQWRGRHYPVLTDDVLYLSGNPVSAYDLKSLQRVAYDTQKKDRKTGKQTKITRHRWNIRRLWECKVDGREGLIKAGDVLYAGGTDQVTALRLAGANPPAEVWSAKIQGKAMRLIAADERLFVVTDTGRLYAFGAEERTARTFAAAAEAGPANSRASVRAAALLKSTGVKSGYALVCGAGQGSMTSELVKASALFVIGLEPDPAAADRLRRLYDAQGIYGTRTSVLCADLVDAKLPSYLASMIVCPAAAVGTPGPGEPFLKNLYRCLRPYGGVACFSCRDADEAAALARRLKAVDLAQAKTTVHGAWVHVIREGALPGSADWTHQYGNVANTVKSDDRLVRLPLGLLWFGGNSHMDVLPRHAHGPCEQVVGGRLFIEGINMLSARDVYTGRVLWKRSFGDLKTFGIYYDKTYHADPLDTSYNQVHIPGANARGTNYVATDDAVYIVKDGDCLVLDPASGKTIRTLTLPATDKGKPGWGYIGVYQDLLIAGAERIAYSEMHKPRKRNAWNHYDVTSSRRLVVMDRRSGEIKWTREAKLGFRHNTIIAGAGKIFCIDRLPAPVRQALEQEGKGPADKPMLLALDAGTGREVWRRSDSVFGTWLGYAAAHDLLVQCGRRSRDQIADEETKRMMALRGEDGAVVWDRQVSHSGPVMLHGKTIYLNARTTEGSALSLLTGQDKQRINPLTGQAMPWTYHRRYGCNSVIASEYLLTFRSGAAGFYDLAGDGGTGNLGGFKSGCTSNLVVADGVLNAPDYTRTCTCPYPNQTSLGLVHMPDMEAWTFNDYRVTGRIRRLGLNLGAPGDRAAPSGTLWLDYPAEGGPSPEVKIETKPQTLARFRFHSTSVQGELPWVAASGVQGLDQMTIHLGRESTDVSEVYSVRLVFAAFDDTPPFGLALQGKTVLNALDVVKEAGGKGRTLIKVFKSVPIKETLEISAVGAPIPVLCGVEILSGKSR